MWGIQDFLPRRNLLTYSEDFSNADWTKVNATATADTITATVSGGLVRHGLPNASAQSTAYNYSVELKDGNVSTAVVYVYNATTSTTLLNQQVTISSGVDMGSSWRLFSFSITSGIALGNNVIFYIYPKAQTGASNGDYVYARKASVVALTTIDQSYQKITDWTTEQYAWAAQRQVPWLRRNIILNTEDVTASAYWQTASNVTTSAGGKITEAATTNTHRISANGNIGISVIAGKEYYLTVNAKKGTKTWQRIKIYATGPNHASELFFNLDTIAFGTVTSLSGAVITNQTITAAADGWYQVSCTVTPGATTTSLVLDFGLASADNTSSYLGAITEYSYFDKFMLSVGSCSYQPILASWNATYTANAIAAGYPIALWQDSAGTSAVNGDNQAIGACWDLKYGSPSIPITFGCFANNAPGWTFSAAVTVSGSTVVVTNGANFAYISGALTPGKTYTCSIVANFSSMNRLRISTTSVGSNDIGTWSTVVGLTTFSKIFTANGSLFSIEADGALVTGIVYNVYVQELPGYTAIQSTTANQPKWRLDSNGFPYFERLTSNVQLTPTFGNEGTCTIYTADQEQTIKESNLTINGATPMLHYGKVYGTVVMKGAGLKASQETKFPKAILKDSAKTLVAPADDWTKVGPTYWKQYKQLRSKSAVSTADTLTTPTGSYPTIPRGCVLMADGRVFSVPSDSTTAYAIYNPTTDSLETINDTLPGNAAFIAGVLLPDGRVFCVPYNSTSARIYNPATNSLSTPTGTYPGSGFGVGGVVMPGGNVFCVPSSSSSARVYNPVTDTLSTPSGTYVSSNGFSGGVLLPDGRVFCVPFDSASARIYDPVTNTTTTPTGTYPGTNSFSCGVLLADGRVYCVPYNSTSARIYDPVTDTLSTPTGAFAGGGAFFGGVLLPDERVYCIPYNSTVGKIYNPFTDTLDSAAGTYPGSGGLYTGALLNDGRVYCAPRASSTARIYNGGYPAQPAARVLSAYDNKF